MIHREYIYSHIGESCKYPDAADGKGCCRILIALFYEDEDWQQ